MSPPFIVVFDTSVLIPLLLPASRSTRLFLRLRSAGIPVALSPQIIEEVREKLFTSNRLRAWLQLPDPELQQFLDRLATTCAVVPGAVTVHGVLAADPEDDKILAAALEAAASYIVSEDRHLLDLGAWQGITITDRDGMMAELDRLVVP